MSTQSALAADTMRNTPKRHTHTHTHTHPRTRTGKWEWAIAERRKWERVPQQYPEGPPALAGGGTGCSRFRASVPRCQWMHEVAGADEVEREADERTCFALPPRRVRTA